MSNKLLHSYCFKLNSINYTTQWAINSSESPLSAYIMPVPALISYKERTVMSSNESIIYFEYCGPFVMLLKAFAEYINREYVYN